MADGFSATVTGDTQVASMLSAASKSLNGDAMELALVSGALLIQNAAKSKAPYLTGTLRRSIHIGGHTGQAGDFAGNDIGGNGPREILVGTNVPYARRIEYGFSGADSLGRVYHQAAQPYLRPAMTEQQGAVIKEVAQALKAILKAQLGAMLT